MHATTCKHLQANHTDLGTDALEESGQGSLGAQIEESTLEPSFKKSKQRTLDLCPLRETGQKSKEEQLHSQNKVDHVIMRLRCVRGPVPNVIDSDEWKELMDLLNGF